MRISDWSSDVCSSDLFHQHRMVELDLDRWIPRKPDQRSMGPLMRYGCIAAGLALESAGILGNKGLLRETHLIAAAGGGERDVQADEQILGALDSAAERSEEHTSELQSLMRISYAVFCVKKKIP